MPGLSTPRRLPPLNWLRTFEVAARTMSFTAAAQALGITQSAVSQQMRLLEATLGRRLFHRLPRGLRLTDAGQALLQLLRDALARIADGAAEIFGESGRPRLMVRSTASFAALWLAPRIARFRRRHPEIEFRLTSSIWPADYPDLDLDLEIRYGSGNWPGLRAERLTRDALFPVCSPALRPRAPAALAQVTLLHVFGFREGWAQWLARAGLAGQVDATAGLEFDLSLVALEAAERGVGIALGRSCYVADRLASGRLVAPFETVLPSEEGFYLAAPEGREPSPAAAAFRNWITAEMAAEGAAAPPLTSRARSGRRQRRR